MSASFSFISRSIVGTNLWYHRLGSPNWYTFLAPLFLDILLLIIVCVWYFALQSHSWLLSECHRNFNIWPVVGSRPILVRFERVYVYKTRWFSIWVTSHLRLLLLSHFWWHAFVGLKPFLIGSFDVRRRWIYRFQSRVLLLYFPHFLIAAFSVLMRVKELFWLIQETK